MKLSGGRAWHQPKGKTGDEAEKERRRRKKMKEKRIKKKEKRIKKKEKRNNEGEDKE